MYSILKSSLIFLEGTMNKEVFFYALLILFLSTSAKSYGEESRRIRVTGSFFSKGEIEIHKNDKGDLKSLQDQKEKDFKMSSTSYRISYISSLNFGMGYSSMKAIATWKWAETSKLFPIVVDLIYKAEIVDFSYTLGDETSLTFGVGLPFSGEGSAKVTHDFTSYNGTKPTFTFITTNINGYSYFLDVGTGISDNFEMILGYRYYDLKYIFDGADVDSGYYGILDSEGSAKFYQYTLGFGFKY